MIHPTAIISNKARIGQNVSIGQFTTIYDNVVIGDNTVIEGYFTDITYLIMELLQILKSRIKLYKEFEIKEIEKIE